MYDSQIRLLSFYVRAMHACKKLLRSNMGKCMDMSAHKRLGEKKNKSKNLRKSNSFIFRTPSQKRK